MAGTRELKKIRKRNVTLIEMMIVMFLIALIAGVVAFNYQASLEQGKAFKTEQGMEKIRTILSLAVAENDDVISDIERNDWLKYLKNSPLVKNAADYEKDGWGQPYQVEVRDGPSGISEITVTSTRYNQYKAGQGK